MIALDWFSRNQCSCSPSTPDLKIETFTPSQELHHITLKEIQGSHLEPVQNPLPQGQHFCRQSRLLEQPPSSHLQLSDWSLPSLPAALCHQSVEVFLPTTLVLSDISAPETANNVASALSHRKGHCSRSEAMRRAQRKAWHWLMVQPAHQLLATNATRCYKWDRI